MKIKIVNLALLLISVIGTLIILSSMPDIIPVHFDFKGVADRWGSKYEMLIMPCIMAVMLGFWFVTDATTVKKQLNSDDEKKRAEAQANQKALNVTFTVISVMFLVFNFAFLYLSYSQLDGVSAMNIDIFKITVIVMGVAFTVMGNIMPKAKNNRNVGFRLTWTRFNDVTWQKTNRMAGIVSVIHGIILILSGIIFSGTTAMIIMLVALCVTLPILTIYAYLVYQDEVKKNEKP